MKTLLISLTLMMASSTALAGPNKLSLGDEQAQRGDHRERIQQELDLSEEQMQQMREIRENGGNREDMRAVLTEEQAAKADELRKRHAGKGDERLARMQKHLELSEEQMTQIRQVREDGGNREDIHALLTEEQQAKLAEVRAGHKGKQRPTQ